MFILDLHSSEKGQLYTQKFTQPNGQFLCIKHTLTNKLSLSTKPINFTQIGFNKQGDRFLACDIHGNIYMFDLNYNRYMKVNRIGTNCTALAYNLKAKTEFLVATIDGTIKCFNIETRDLVGWMRGHEKPIISLSVHTTGEFVISFSADIAQLWDLKSFECKQKLNINSKNNVEIIKLGFAPSTNDIVSVFKDDSIYVWSFESIEFKCQLSADNDFKFYKCYTISSDGKILVAAGRSNRIDIWSIENKALLKSIKLNEIIQSVRDCILLSGLYENKILILLTHDGQIEAINIDTDKYLACVNSKTNQNVANEKVTGIQASANARYLCSITDSGQIQVYDLDCSFLAKYKITTNLMKTATTFNNTTQHQQTLNQPPSRLVNLTGSSSAGPNNSSLTNKLKQQQKLTNKKIVCKRAQQLLSNENIYSKLVNILACYGEYPARYRMFVWKLLLKLPENYESYSALIQKGVHLKFVDLHKKYPIKSQKCNRLLQRTLSVLANWAPILADCEYLPLLIFPFVKLFQNNHVTCFEIIVTFLNNWCQHWFELFPNPPVNILNMVENLIAYHDRTLIDHFMRYRITSQIFAWSLLETIFSEVFNKDEWQILFDNVFSNPPGYFIYLAATYTLCNRSALLRITEIDDAKFFYRHRNPISVKFLVRECDRIKQSTPSDIDPIKLLDSFEPIVKGSYPVFNKRPKFISDYQIREKKKILQEEIDYLKEREEHLESHKLNEGKKLENEFMLKQLYVDKELNRQNQRLFYDDHKQKMSQHTDYNSKNIEVNVAGLPVQYFDANGNAYLNKMKRIDENFDDIENNLDRERRLNTRLEELADDQDDGMDEIENANIDFLFESIEKEMKSGLSSEASKPFDSRANILNRQNSTIENQMKSMPPVKCLNESQATETSTAWSLDRGRENIELQERELMQRVYEIRKTIALEGRNKVKGINLTHD